MWMLLAAFYPVLLGLLLASLIFTGGNALGLSGLQAMIGFYAISIMLMLVLATVKGPSEDEFDQ
jgi:ferrous iron transport protein B